MRKDRNNMTIEQIIEQIPAEELKAPKFIMINGEYVPIEEATRKSVIITNPATGAGTSDPKIMVHIIKALQGRGQEIADKYAEFEPPAEKKDFTEKILDIIFEDFFDIMETITAEEAEKVIKSFSPLGISKDEYIEILQNKLMNTQIQAPNATPEARRIIALICYALRSGKKKFKKSNAELAELFGVSDRQKLRGRIIEAANEVTNIHIDDFTIKGAKKEITYIGGIATCRVEQDNKTKACTLYVSIAPDLIELIHSDGIYFHPLTMHANDLYLPQKNEADILPLIDYVRTYYRQNGKGKNDKGKPIPAATVFRLLYKKPIEEYREPCKALRRFHDKLYHINSQRGFEWAYCDRYGNSRPAEWKPISRGELNDAYIIFNIPSSPTDELAESCQKRREEERKKHQSAGKIHKK